MPQELRDYDTVVFDPPRQGAQAQATRLAASKVATVVAVSCNVATFARDARIFGSRVATASKASRRSTSSAAHACM